MRGWLLVASVAAAFALCGPSPEPGAQTNQSAAEHKKRDSAPTPTRAPQALEPIQPVEYYRPCWSDRKDGNSDLCAQWTAAKGATDAAYWAKWGFWLSVAGLLGLLATLYYTRKAVLAAEEGTKDADSALAIADRNARAAADQVRVSEETADRQLRPYVYLTAVHMSVERFMASVGDRAPITLHFQNFGQTPAKHCKFRVKIFLGGMWNEDFDTSFDDEPIVRLGDMPPGFTKDQDGFSITGLKEAADGILVCVASIFVCGLIEYDDGRGGSFKTEFRLACTGSDLLKSRFGPTPRGNESD